MVRIFKNTNIDINKTTLYKNSKYTIGLYTSPDDNLLDVLKTDTLSPLEYRIKEEKYSFLRNVMKQCLSNDEYCIMYSKYIDERSIIEVSEHFNINQNTVKVHIFNSKKKKLIQIYNI